MSALIQVLVVVGLPGLVLLGTRVFKPVAWVGPVVMCYAAGILLGNAPGLSLQTGVSLSVSEAAVPLAIPLLLFSTDVPRWTRLARTTLLSFALACVSALVSATVVGLAFSGRMDEWWKMAGMLVGVYVGGTANMNAVGVALQVREETFVLLNTADIVAGAAYLLVLMTVAQRIALAFLPPFPNPTGWDGSTAEEGTRQDGFSWRFARGLALSLLLAVAICGVSAGVSLGLAGRLEATVVLLLITTLSLAASFIPAVRSLPGSYALGDYALLVFCVAVGTLADASQLGSAGLSVFVFCASVMVLAIVLHFGLAALFRIDADTVLITSTATIFGPAFIAPVARALRNRELMVSGITTGLMGFALGTYLGLALSWLLRP
ncbi:DUF819 family protein [Myxococcus llanfairpwllgwyngyllgogerychwyrndrobwllllantysiliogogogochensis]|uniref:DUF819 family protein n=1 Tax=Myxococcus llanfairpwllgwyngyllgogerychwyrndrobwllllantysiliogogogochensis TaxID=2590453 RepID=A0A540X032_9BACT|nr:DUF819 family protein [Myxococcus llanfairpwllgwyngyllgogerychwyrndrobwllllantysiliogogogochensis]TQF14094.1 DUF819 family protein [Myxococcus llanfairpwllgwyngyllgogerychwyrndrobwllllantysiliogogogochensis]